MSSWFWLNKLCHKWICLSCGREFPTCECMEQCCLSLWFRFFSRFWWFNGLPELPLQCNTSKVLYDMKALMSKDVLLSNPDHNISFTIYNDVSNYQLGRDIFHNNIPVAYYSLRLSAAQHNSTFGGCHMKWILYYKYKSNAAICFYSTCILHQKSVLNIADTTQYLIYVVFLMSFVRDSHQ